jgi:DNA-directed RNA polymerase specialized sigma24 family protein
VIELYPNPVPPHPLFDRAGALAGLQAAFALLDDDELQVVRLRLLGVRLVAIAEELGVHDEDVERTWKRARKKLGNALFGKQPSPPTT